MNIVNSSLIPRTWSLQQQVQEEEEPSNVSIVELQSNP